MGVDLGYGYSNGYLASFTRISRYTWQEALFVNVLNYERGYILLNKFLSLFSTDQQFFIAANVFIALLPMFYIIYKESHSPALSTVIFMGLPSFMMLFSGARQTIAICICFVALYFVKNKKLIPFLVTVLFATTFHSSAWIFVIAYPLYYLKMSRSLRKLSFAILPVVYFLRYPLFHLFSVLFKDNATVDNNGAKTLFIVFSLVYIFCSMFSDEREETAGLKNLFFVACCIQGLGGVNSLVMRVGYYFMNSLILLLPLIIHNLSNKTNARIIRAVVGLCFVLFGLYSLRTGSWSRAYPYYWFWTENIRVII